MPTTIYVPQEIPDKHSGISITWTRSAQRLDISGWYDQFVGIEGNSFRLAEFFQKLGITKKDIMGALSEMGLT